MTKKKQKAINKWYAWVVDEYWRTNLELINRFQKEWEEYLKTI